MSNIITTVQAMGTLKERMRQDPAYAHSWHANIAMAMFDEFPDSFWVPDRGQQHKISNAAATRFMKNVFNVDTSQEMLLNDNSDSS